MALWGKTDATGSKPKYLNTTDLANAVFVSREEAVLKTNKDKGILGAGWWIVKEFTDSEGKPRYHSECLVAMSVANATSGDAADDAKVADVEVSITISAQPTNQYFWNGHPAVFSVTASANTGSLTYQWQKKGVTEGARWENISGATSATYSTTNTLVDADDRTAFRVVIGSTSGAVKVTSAEALALLD